MLKELSIPAIVVVLAVAFLDPFMVLMPSTLVHFFLGGLLVTFVVYALHIVHESPRDEREEAHRAYAARVAYLVGSGALVFGIMYEVLVLHSVDPVIVIALVGMTVAKYATALYAAKHF